MPKNKERSLKSYLVILILHIIKWYSQPWGRSQSWVQSISNARKEISQILKEHPSLLRLVDLLIPEACRMAIRQAEKEMGFPPTYTEPTPADLFEKDYDLKDKK